jgi:hypothetical protein
VRREKAAANAATKRADEVLRLSVLQRLVDHEPEAGAGLARQATETQLGPCGESE